MLPVGIVALMMGVVVASYGPSAAGNGSLIFAAGFFVTATIALLSAWRGHPAV